MLTPTMKILGAPLVVAMLYQGSFSTAQTANLRKAFTVASEFGVPRFATASLPACGTNNKGAVALDSTTNTFKYCNGTAWIETSGGGGGTAGYIQGVATGSLVACAAGTTGLVAYDTTLARLVVCNGSAYVETVGPASGIQGVATASLPACAAGRTGFVAYDTTLKQLMLCNGTAYVQKVGTTVLYSTAVAVTTTGTIIETVGTYALPAGFLDTDANGITIELVGSCAANNNSKVVDILFGAATVVSFTTTTACNNTGFFAQASVIRRSATTQAIGSGIQYNANSGSGRYGPGAETLANSITILVRFTTPTTLGDLTLQSFRVISDR